MKIENNVFRNAELNKTSFYRVFTLFTYCMFALKCVSVRLPGPLPPALTSRSSCFLIWFLTTSTFNDLRERFFFNALMAFFSWGVLSWLSEELLLLLLLLLELLELSPEPLLELLVLFDNPLSFGPFLFMFFCFLSPSRLSELELLLLLLLFESEEVELDEEL